MTIVLLTLLGLLSATLLVGIWIGPALIGIGIVMLDVFTSRPTMRQIRGRFASAVHPDG